MAADSPMLAKHVNATGHVMNALEKEPGAAVLFAVNKEFGKSVDWLLTEKVFVESKQSSPVMEIYSCLL